VEFSLVLSEMVLRAHPQRRVELFSLIRKPDASYLAPAICESQL